MSRGTSHYNIFKIKKSHQFSTPDAFRILRLFLRGHSAYMSSLEVNIEQKIWEMYSYCSYAKLWGSIASSVIYFHPTPSINVIFKIKRAGLISNTTFLFVAVYVGGAK
jgi:hypothetical protein